MDCDHRYVDGDESPEREKEDSVELTREEREALARVLQLDLETQQKEAERKKEPEGDPDST